MKTAISEQLETSFFGNTYNGEYNNKKQIQDTNKILSINTISNTVSL